MNANLYTNNYKLQPSRNSKLKDQSKHKQGVRERELSKRQSGEKELVFS